MTQDGCTRLSEKIPDVARGLGRWTDQEAAHLGECAACQAEWRLAQTAIRLGRRAESMVDPERVALAVTRRLWAAPRRPRLVRRVVWAGGILGAAAALALALRTAAAPGVRPDPPATVTSLALDLPGLDSLDVHELEWVLESIDEPIAAGSTLEAPGIETLEDPELERLLRAWGEEG